MMYNQQHQFPMGASGAFPGPPNPAAMLPGGAGHAGMMQNTAMPHMAANGPQGQFNPNYMMSNSMGGFPMSASGMTPQQQMMQRMQQQAQQNAAGTFRKPTKSPTHAADPDSHASSTVGNQCLDSSDTNFSLYRARTGCKRQLDPVESTELLYEAVHLKHSMDEAKKERMSSTDAEKQKEKMEEEEACSHDWTKRLQANLAYLASLADRKAPSQAAPAYLSPPPLNLKLKLRPIAPTPDAEKVDGSADREERENIIKEQYQKLQALFPGIDPNKVPNLRPQPNPGAPNPAAALQNAQRAASIGAPQGQMHVSSAPSPAPSAQQGTPQMSTVPAPQTSQPMMSA
ncbi:hypothetical protein VSDG_02662 [Cytospora chrysosperma]|uniref:Uncharacterized protein n=1 Tax=Cytospora chrysosperma TaxID=252740 RepID=A0A423WC87_CYTCH|nr:hypothetical protein VSDG_02662 [Valsa sordida]